MLASGSFVARVDDVIEKIDQEVNDDIRTGRDEHDREHDRNILTVGGLRHESTDALLGEKRLDDDSSAEQMGEDKARQRHERNERVSQRMTVANRSFRQTTRASGRDERLFENIFELLPQHLGKNRGRRQA